LFPDGWLKDKKHILLSSFVKEHWFTPLLNYAKEHGKTKKSWSWYRKNIPDGDKLPYDFYYDTYYSGPGTGDDAFKISTLWFPKSWFSHTEETEENVHYDAPVLKFYVDGDKHQYHSYRERDVSTNSYWYKHRDKVKQYQEK
jgi:hypothetical protein